MQMSPLYKLKWHSSGKSERAQAKVVLEREREKERERIRERERERERAERELRESELTQARGLLLIPMPYCTVRRKR